MGARLHDLAHGRDARVVTPDRAAKSISAETTFDADIAELTALRVQLWRLCEKVSARMKAKGLVGRTAVLKLKRADFRTLTRRRCLPPTQLADALFAATAPLLAEAAAQGPFRLIGVGFGDLAPSTVAEAALFDDGATARARAEAAVDAIRARFGEAAIGKGRGLG
jgi:DNA polymerase-4